MWIANSVIPDQTTLGLHCMSKNSMWIANNVIPDQTTLGLHCMLKNSMWIVNSVIPDQTALIVLECGYKTEQPQCYT